MHGDTEIPATATDLEDEYEILREIGRGGTAIVYHARDRLLDRDVAIKVIRARYAADDETVARLAREARMVAHLQHPNIVAIHAVRRLRDDGLALVMQFIPGRTLRQRLLDDGPLPMEAAERVISDIAQALAHAHAHGIVHRDVKPENIFLDDATGRALLSDFGVARSLHHDTQLTATGMAIGTPTYMSPEQIDGGALDGRSDLYALGLVAWEMLSGQRPWDGEGLYGVIFKQKREDLPPLDGLRPDIPNHLLYCIEGLLPKQPEERFTSAHALLEQLAHPTPAGGWRRWKADRRKRLRARTYTEARARGASVVGAALETVRFRRSAAAPPPTPDEQEVAPPPSRDVPAPELTPLEGERTPESVPLEVGSPTRATPFTDGRLTTVEGDNDPSEFAQLLRDRLGDLAEPLPAEPSNTRRVVVAIAALALVVVGGSTAAILGIARHSRERVVSNGDIATFRDRPGVDVPITRTPPRLPGVDVESRDSPPARNDTAASARDAALLERLSAPDVRGAESPAPSAPSVDSSAEQFSTATSTQPSDTPTLRPTPPRAATGTLRTPTPRLPARSGRMLSDWGELRADSSSGAIARATTRSGVPDAAPNAAPSIGAVPLARTRAVTFPAERSIIGAGGRHSCLVASDGAAECWGANDRGQLGDGTTDNHARPAAVASDLRFTQITTGNSHTCALSSGGDAYCWGNNDRGQLGDATTTMRTAPVHVVGGSPIRLVRAGANHTCAIARDGTLLCWGSNDDGQLGLGTSSGRNAPSVVAPELRFGALATGAAHSCAITLDGAVYCWGSNASGQLGDGTRTERRTPVRVHSDERFSSVAAGNAHTCAVTVDGDVYCWGGNAFGQLGVGAGGDRLAPTRVSGRSDFIAVTAGGVHSCARTRGGQLYCWGRNTYGQLGEGDTIDQPFPVRVASGATFISVIANGAHTCALDASGVSYCWGYNVAGQLGDGTRSHQSRPVRVAAESRR